MVRHGNCGPAPPDTVGIFASLECSDWLGGFSSRLLRLHVLCLIRSVRPHHVWTRQRLESYVGTTETLITEFKSLRSLIGDDRKDKDTKMREAAKDVAAMANEQGGVIVYGIAEEGSGTGKRAAQVEDGFVAEHGVSREWFLQFIRDRVHPPLPDIDAVEVPLTKKNDRFALVVQVPMATGIARQTDDHLFWRRDGQGLHSMTVREIEDVSLRATRPQLVLQVHNVETKVTRDCPGGQSAVQDYQRVTRDRHLRRRNTGLVVAFVGQSCEPF